jgi:hypothetical protein
MTRYVLLIALVAAPAAFAQVNVTVDLPTFRFEAAPPLVVVEPGVQVVPGYHEEVFFVNGHYWTRRGGRWFHTGDWRGGWIEAQPHYVPPALVRIQPGRYVQWRAEEHREWREREQRAQMERERIERERAREREARHEWREGERREERREEHPAERREMRHEERREERHEERREERRPQQGNERREEERRRDER